MVRLGSWGIYLAKALVIVDRGVVFPPPVLCCGIGSFDITIHSWSFEVRTTNPAPVICQQPWICEGGDYSHTAGDLVGLCAWRYFPPGGNACFIQCDEPFIQVNVIQGGPFAGCTAVFRWSGSTECFDGSLEQAWVVFAQVPIPNEGPPTYCPLPPAGPIEFDASHFGVFTTCNINTGPGVTFITPGPNSFSIDAINYL